MYVCKFNKVGKIRVLQHCLTSSICYTQLCANLEWLDVAGSYVTYVLFLKIVFSNLASRGFFAQLLLVFEGLVVRLY